jgi:uncharacterized alpha-E superfamily protein
MRFRKRLHRDREVEAVLDRHHHVHHLDRVEARLGGEVGVEAEVGGARTNLDEGRAHDLDWLLDFADSGVTYRSRYLAAPEWLPVLDMLVRDDANPRSLVFQARALADYIGRLEVAHGGFAAETFAPAHQALLDLRAADLHPESDTLSAVVDQLQRAAYQISDQVSMKFFSHALPRSNLSLGA